MLGMWVRQHISKAMHTAQGPSPLSAPSTTSAACAPTASCRCRSCSRSPIRPARCTMPVCQRGRVRECVSMVKVAMHAAG